jgi:hypothetical protein
VHRSDSIGSKLDADIGSGKSIKLQAIPGNKSPEIPRGETVGFWNQPRERDASLGTDPGNLSLSRLRIAGAELSTRFE